MIVRNEAHGIKATLDSVKNHVDRWTILDTGSTDGTQDAIRHAMEGIPGDLIEGEFVDFSSSRNSALDAHGEKTQWVLMLDADDIVSGGEFLRPAILAAEKEQALLVCRRMITSWHVPLLLRARSSWRYRGRVHEYVCGPNGEHAGKMVDGVAIFHERPPQSSEASRARWERDRVLLEDDLATGQDRERTTYYLAQTYDCLGNRAKAAELYAARAGMQGWQQETFQAKLRLGLCLLSLGKDADGVMALLSAHSFDPSRAEPLFHIAEFFRLRGDHASSFAFASRAARISRPASGMFVDDEVYEWKIKDVLAISAYYVAKATGDKTVWREGLDAASAALAARPADARLVRNRAFFG
jgi:hypothetical protein